MRIARIEYKITRRNIIQESNVIDLGLHLENLAVNEMLKSNHTSHDNLSDSFEKIVEDDKSVEVKEISMEEKSIPVAVKVENMPQDKGDEVLEGWNLKNDDAKCSNDTPLKDGDEF